MSAPFTVKAKFPYTPEAENATDDLSFAAGQKITVTEVVDDDWLFGTYTDSKGDLLSGYFPKSFVETVTEDQITPAGTAATPPAPAPTAEETNEPVKYGKSKEIDTPVSIPDPTSTSTSTTTHQEPVEEDKDAHMLAFKNKLKSFNVESAPPLPFKAPAEQSYIKKSFSGASPHSNYVPPSLYKSPQEQKVVPVKVERPADIVSEHTDDHHDEEEAPKLTLKQRMQMLEAGRKEEEAALAAALKRKSEKKAAKKHSKMEGNTTGGSIASTTSTGSGSYSHTQAHSNMTGESIAEGEESVMPVVPTSKMIPEADDEFEDAQEDQEQQEETDEEERQDDDDEDEDENDQVDDGSEDGDEEEEEDDEEEKKRQLRERMAKLSGGMGMMGMMGFAMPAASKPSTTKTKKKKKATEESDIKQSYSDVPAAIPIMPFASGASLPPALAKQSKIESEEEGFEEEEDEPETPHISDVKPVESSEDSEAVDKVTLSETPDVALEQKNERVKEEETIVDSKQNELHIPPPIPTVSETGSHSAHPSISGASVQSVEVVDEFVDSSEEEGDFDTPTNEKDMNILGAARTDTEEDAGTTTGYEADEDSNFATAEKVYTSPVKPKLVSSPVRSSFGVEGARSHPPPPPPPPAAAPPPTVAVPGIPPQVPQSPIARSIPQIPQSPTERPMAHPPIPGSMPPVPSVSHREPVSAPPAPPAPAVPAPSALETFSESRHTYHSAPPPPPPPTAAAPVPVPTPRSPTTAVPPPVPSPTSQFHSSIPARRSMEVQQIRSTNTGTIIPEIATPQFSQSWWLSKEIPPEVSGKDIYFETETHDIVKRGKRTVKYIDYYIVSMDYSQKVWELSYDVADPTKLLSFHESHVPSPTNISESYLIEASMKYGARAIQVASSVVGSLSLKEDLISWTLSQIPHVLPKIGGKTFGATIYRNNNNAEISTIDDFRPGDILVVVKGKFESTGAFHKKSYELGMKTPYAAIISSFDQTKKKIRVIEQSSTKGIHNNGYRLQDMKSGRVRVFRLVGRDYIGW